MNLGTLISTVLDITGTPDRELYVRSQVNGVLRRIHGLHDFYQDLVEERIAVSPSASVINITKPVNFRAVAYLRPLPYNKLLDFVPPSRIINASQSQELTNCYYLSGNTILARLRNGYQTSTIAFGHYDYPVMPVADTDSTWSMVDFDMLITEILAAKLLRVTGDVTTAQHMETGSNGILAQMEAIHSAGTYDR